MAEEKEVRRFWPGENSRGFTEEEEAEWSKSSEWRNMVRVEAMRDARRARLQKEEEARKWSATDAGKLLRQLGESFKLYRDYLERNPELQEKALECDEMNQKIFHQMRSNIEKANNAPRCRYQKANGMACRAPRVRGKKYCHMHMMLEEARPQRISLPNLGDPAGIQAAIAKGAQAVVDGTLEQKQASILAYYLQLAVSNVGKVDAEEPVAAE